MTSELPNLSPVLPELVMALGAMALLMIGVFRGERGFTLVNTLSVLLLVAAGLLAVLSVGGERQLTFGAMFVSDSFAVFAKTLILGGSAVALLLAPQFLKDHGIDRFEYPVLVLLATLGMMIMVSANNLISLYVGLELQSLSLYVLAAINRDKARSTEAGLTMAMPAMAIIAKTDPTGSAA